MPQVRVGVLVKVRVSFRVGGQPDNCPGGKIPPLGFGLGLVLGLGGGAIFLGGNCPRTENFTYELSNSGKDFLRLISLSSFHLKRDCEVTVIIF